MSKLPTQAYLRSRFDYNPATGALTWRRLGKDNPTREQKRWNTRFAGKRAGTLRKDGYRALLIDNKSYNSEHRVVWKMIHGTEPEAIDHKNGVRDDNRIANLRKADKSLNAANQKPRSDNKLGLTGVRITPSGKFSVVLTVNGKARRIGTYRTAHVAAWAYRQASLGAYGEHAYAARTD